MAVQKSFGIVTDRTTPTVTYSQTNLNDVTVTPRPQFARFTGTGTAADSGSYVNSINADAEI